MSKRNTILISVLLIAASLVIQFLLNNSIEYPKNELLEFVSGILFGAGISILLFTLFKKKK